MKGIIIKDDARYSYCEKYLKNRGHTFCGTDSTEFVIFPFVKDVEPSIYDDAFFADLRRGTPVFSGVRNEYIAAQCEKHGHNYHAIIDDRAVATRNAVPTSEGVIAYMIANRNETIVGSRVLVIGYGICGRDLCKRLKGLGADVYALVRNREKAAGAQTDGIAPVFAERLFEAATFDVVINTVPERVLSNEELDKTSGALLIDIASSPYGFDMEYAKKLNSKSALLPGIPGKFAAKTAGEILGEYINSILTGR